MFLLPDRRNLEKVGDIASVALLLAPLCVFTLTIIQLRKNTHEPLASTCNPTRNHRGSRTMSAFRFPDGVHYIDHEKIAAAMVNGARVVEDAGLVVIANRGRQRGAEMHARTNHVFIIVDGEAEFVTGGTMIEPKQTALDQTRGKGIEGGVTRHLSKGDVIVIPANTPHWWKDTSKTGSVGYYAVNYEM